MLDFNKIRVLLTDGDGRQTLTILHGLKELGCHVTVVCSSKKSISYVSRLPDERIIYTEKDGSYVDFILSHVKTDSFDVLLPVAENSTNIITSNEEEIGKYVRIACAPREAYIKAFNKQITFDTAIDVGIPCPYTRNSEQSVEDFVENAHFPVIIKPRQGMGSMGFHKIKTKEEFWDMMSKGQIDPDSYVIQEFVTFDKRIDAFVFIDQKGRVATSMAVEVLRWYPLDAGTSTFTRTVDNSDIIKYGSGILKALNWRGFADVSFMIESSTGEPKLMEINGRIPAGIKLSWFCGYNVARQLIEMAYDEDVTLYPNNDKFGMMARHSQADLMWFLKSKDRFRASPSWFSWKNTTDLVFWKNDPKPFFVYSLDAVFQYQDFMRKRKH